MVETLWIQKSGINNANNVVRGKNKASVNNNNAKGGVTKKGGNKSKRRENTATIETLWIQKSGINNANNVVRGKSKASVNNNNAKGGAAKKGGNKSKRRENSATIETLWIQKSGINNANNVVRGKNKASVNNNNAKGSAAKKGGNQSKRRENTATIETLWIQKSGINNANNIVRGKNKANVNNNNAKRGAKKKGGNKSKRREKGETTHWHQFWALQVSSK
uniref:Uncharacterized protein n=1 Tax=Fagus sylvatica TaxID=28930 RepID=A0A2N9F4P5_FAGSY